MVILVFFASIGYFRSNLMDQDHFPDGNGVTADSTTLGDEEEKHLEEQNQRKAAKNLTLLSEDKKTSRLYDYKNKVIILSFWASWCAPCLEELPTFAKLVQKFGPDKLAVIPINIEDEEELDKKFIETLWKKNQITFPTFYDPKQLNAQAMDVQVMPTNFVLDKHGRIAFSSFGYNNWASSKAVSFIQALIEEN